MNVEELIYGSFKLESRTCPLKCIKTLLKIMVLNREVLFFVSNYHDLSWKYWKLERTNLYTLYTTRYTENRPAFVITSNNTQQNLLPSRSYFQKAF